MIIRNAGIADIDKIIKNRMDFLISFDIGGVKYMLTWQYNDIHLFCGGQLEKSELLKIPGKLVQSTHLKN